MYSNDVRVANTAAPSFQAKANVTQYGWTDVDQGHYNQLIQYVDECRQIWKDLSEKIEYIEGLLVQVGSIDEQVQFVNQKANEVAEDARQTRTDVIMSTTLLNQMILLNTDFQTKYTDFVDKYPDFLIKYEETVLNAAHAAVSATESEGWFNKTYDLYLDLKNGQVYRGTWNPSSGNFPAHGGTNSVWDVILDAGLDSVDYGSFTWHNGDRLLYILAEAKYDQLRTGSGVLSVNGKTGAVTLVPKDIGALGATEPSVSTARFTTPVKIAGKEFDGSGDLEIYPGDIDAASKYITVNGQGLDKNVILTSEDVGAIGTHQAETGNGLVMRVGGARDQAITAALADATGGAYMAETPPTNPIPGARWFDTNDGRTYLYYVDGDSSQWIEENPQSPDIIQTSPLLQELANNRRLDTTVQMTGDFEIFHEGNNPGIEDVKDLVTVLNETEAKLAAAEAKVAALEAKNDKHYFFGRDFVQMDIGTESSILPVVSSVNSIYGIKQHNDKNGITVTKKGRYRVSYSYDLEPTNYNQNTVLSVYAGSPGITGATVAYNYKPSLSVATVMTPTIFTEVVDLEAGDDVYFRVATVNSTSGKIWRLGHFQVEEI